MRASLLLALAIPGTAYASDPSGLVGPMYLVLAVAFGVVYVIVWLATRRMRSYSLRWLIRALAIAAFWAPPGVDGETYWPPPVLLLDGQLAGAARSILITALVIWGVAILIRKFRESRGA